MIQFRVFCQLILSTQKAWSGLSPTRNRVHLRLWGLSFPSVEIQSEPVQDFLGPKVRTQTFESPKNASWEFDGDRTGSEVYSYTQKKRVQKQCPWGTIATTCTNSTLFHMKKMPLKCGEHFIDFWS